MDAADVFASEEASRRKRRLRQLALGALIAALGIGLLAFWAKRPTAYEAPSIERAYLWSVIGANGPTYFFGTLHVGFTAGDLPTNVLGAQKSSRITVVESDQRKERAIDDPVYLGRPPTLSDATWKKLSKEIGEPEETLRKLRPARIAGLLIGATAPGGRMDIDLQRRATKLGHELEFLDSDQAIEAGMRSMEESLSDQRLEMMVKNQSLLRSALETQIELYAKGKVASGNDVGGVHERNKLWLPRLRHHAREGGAFIAVGAAHLVGANSLIQTLESEGFSITRVETR